MHGRRLKAAPEPRKDWGGIAGPLPGSANDVSLRAAKPVLPATFPAPPLRSREVRFVVVAPLVGQLEPSSPAGGDTCIASCFWRNHFLARSALTSFSMPKNHR